MKKIITLALIIVIVMSCGCSALINSFLGNSPASKQTPIQTAKPVIEPAPTPIIEPTPIPEVEPEPEETPEPTTAPTPESTVNHPTPKPTENPNPGETIEDLTGGFTPKTIYIDPKSKYNGESIKKGKWIREDGRAVLFIEFGFSNYEFGFECYVLPDRYMEFLYASAADVDYNDKTKAYDQYAQEGEEFTLKAVSDGLLEISTNKAFRTAFYNMDYDKPKGQTEIPDGKYYFVK